MRRTKLDRLIEEARGMGWDPEWLRNSLIPMVRQAGGTVIDGHPVPYSVTVTLHRVKRYVHQDGRVERRAC